MANTARRSDGGTTSRKETYISKYCDFVAGNQGNLATGEAFTDGECDSAASSASASNIAAVTMTADAINTCAHDTNAAGSVYLPKATPGVHTVLEIDGDMDEANAFTIFARGAAGATTTATFARQLISPLYSGGASADDEAVLTTGTVSTPTAIKLIYTPAAADTNFLGANSFIHFFCAVEDQWLVKVFNVPEGNGSTGAFTTATS
jgi:hypothetical protein